MRFRNNVIYSHVSFYSAFFLLCILPALVSSATAQTFSCANVTQIPHTECNALIAFYNSANGANMTH